MNVLQFICPTGFYGAERWVLALAKNLSPDAARCDLAVTLESESQNLELVKKYREFGLDAFEIPMSNKFDIRVVNRLVALIKERQIDVIHTHGYKSDIIGVLAARKANIKVVVTPHGFENARDIKLRLFIWLGCQAMRFGDAVVPLSPDLMKDVEKIGVKKQKTYYIQNGVDLSEVEMQKSQPVQFRCPGEKRIGFIGQLISRKNLTAMLSIFESLAQKHDNVRLTLLGDGEERPALEEYAKTLEHGDRIEFLGFRDDRLSYLQSFDLFAMTSTLEGIPRCLMESAAMGVPMAAFDIPGVNEIIIHGKTGLTAPPGNYDALEKCWERLLYEPNTAKDLSDSALTFVYENFSAKRMADEYLDLFQSLTRS